MQSVCNQYAISMQSVCNQYAISRPSPRTPARAAAVEGARAWVHPAADRAARRPRRAKCRRRCTPPEEGGNQHALRDAISDRAAGRWRSGAIISNQKQSPPPLQESQSEAIRKQSPPPLQESREHRGHDGGDLPRQYRHRSCTQARSSGRSSMVMSALGGNHPVHSEAIRSAITCRGHEW